jgi:hypothetical protein
MRFKGRIVGAFMLQCEQKRNQDTMRDHHNLPQGQGEINPRTCPPPNAAQYTIKWRNPCASERAFKRALSLGFRVLKKLL